MRRDFINKIIAGTIISTTLCTLVPIKASAEWVSDYQNNRYYMQDGQKLTGWKKIDGNLYYFDNNGKMLTGWLKAENSNYFLQNDGALKIGWFKYDRNWYYSDSNGVIQTGTLNIAGKVYILNDNGIMQTNNTVINGQFYTIGSDGVVAGATTPTPDKEFDGAGNVLAVLKNTESKGSISPTYSSFNDVIKDQSVSNDDPNEGRTFKVRFKDSNGAELKVKSIKNGKTVDLYVPTKDGYVFGSWNTKSDGSGKSYSSDDNIKVKEDINLYAQWTGDTTAYIDGIVIKGSSYVTVNKTSQMTAEISPSEAASIGVTWSVTDGTGKATIDSNTGVLTGVTAGTVTVKATSKDKSKFSVTKEITVSTTDIVVPVTKISVGSKTGVFAITASGGTLQMTASVYPDNANNQDVTWSVDNIGGSASIDPTTGLVTAISDGIVTVKATAKDGSGVTGNTTIKISGQSVKIPVTSVNISGKNGATTITTDVAEGGTSGILQVSADILPATASNKALTWSVVSGKEFASISSTGLITAISNGTFVVQAISNEAGIVSNKLSIEITGQTIKLTGISIAGVNSISGDTDFNVVTTPVGAAIKDVKWIVENQTGSAVLTNDTGIKTTLKPQSNGNVVLKAIATAKDGTVVPTATYNVLIGGQSSDVLVKSVVVSGKDNATSISKDGGTLQMIATIAPSYATITTSQAVTWTVSSGAGGGSAKIDPNTGLLTAIADGPVLVEAKLINKVDEDPSIVYKAKTINIYGQFVQVNTINIGSDEEVAVNGTLKLNPIIDPVGAKFKDVTWSITSLDGGSVKIDAATGILTGVTDGNVAITAISTDGYKTNSNTKKIKINKEVQVAGITVDALDNTNASADTIATMGGTLNMTASFSNIPTNNAVTWAVEPYGGATGTDVKGAANILDNGNGTAKLTAVSNGKVRVTATAKDGSGKVGEKIITLTNQFVKMTGVTVSGYLSAEKIDTNGGTLQMAAVLAPIDATVPASVIWSVETVSDTGKGMTGIAKIDPTTGILTAIANGTVNVKATVTGTDGTKFVVGKVITISNQIVIVTGITITAPVYTVGINKTLQLTANITTTTTTTAVATKGVVWTVSDPTKANIDTDGVLTGIATGGVTVTATSTDDNSKIATKYIPIG